MKKDDINSLEQVQGRRISSLESKVETLETGLELILGELGVKMAREIAVTTIMAWNDPPRYFLKRVDKSQVDNKED